MARHEDLTDAHIPYRWTYANAAARTGATGFVTVDIGKLALQTDTSVLYLLTAVTPTWVAVGGSASSVVDQSTCQGRLTLTSGTAVTTVDVTAATNIYFTPMGGNLIALYDGLAWESFSFSELTLSLSGLAAGKNYDVFIYDSSGLVLEAVQWTNDTARATALVLQDGVYVKSGATGRRYLGTFRTTATIGQCEDSKSKRYLWNYYNRMPRYLSIIETTDSWTYASAAWRAVNNSAANKVEMVFGVSDELVQATVRCKIQTGTGKAGSMSVGVDSAAANSAQVVDDLTLAGTDTTVYGGADYWGYPGLGYHYLQWIEYARAGTVTFFGDGGNATQQSGMLALLNG